MTCKTLKDLFEDLYIGEYLLFDTEEKKQDVRKQLNCNFRWKSGTGIEVVQVLTILGEQKDKKRRSYLSSSNPSSCTCRPGFKGDDAFCKFHND